LSVPALVRSSGKQDFPERRELHRTYRLAPGTGVEVSTIAGPVDITTANNDTAEIHVIDSAPTPDGADAKNARLIVEPLSGAHRVGTI
jgi:hypothetical protein